MTKLKRIVNRQEERTLREIQEISRKYEYNLYTKIRLADVLNIEGSGIESDYYSFSLKSHFDFLVCDMRQYPLFAIEFDGPTHQEHRQTLRDQKKNTLCERFNLPLLRIKNNHLLKKYNKASLLQWIISAWELQKGFYAVQADGQIPIDEDFDPVMLWHSGKTLEEIHPHWIALRPRLHIEKLHKEGQLPVRHTCSMTFTDEQENSRGIEWIDVGGDQVVYIESAMRKQQFPIYLGELFREILTVSLHEKLIYFLETGNGAVAPKTVSCRLKELNEKYTFSGSFTGKTLVQFSLNPFIKNS